MVLRDDSPNSKSSSVNLDCEGMVGTVCHWPPDSFEFQFNDVESGRVLVLETKSFDDKQDLDSYMQALLNRLQADQGS